MGKRRWDLTGKRKDGRTERELLCGSEREGRVQGTDVEEQKKR